MTTCIVKHNVESFAEVLMPYNHTVGVEVRDNFMHHTISLEMDQYNKRTKHNKYGVMKNIWLSG